VIRLSQSGLLGSIPQSKPRYSDKKGDVIQYTLEFYGEGVVAKKDRS
jgi:hypothetical protein